MGVKYRAIIVDDEELARKDLAALLDMHDEIEIIGEAADLKEAVDLLAEKDIDLIFLDIKLRGESGFDLLTDLRKNIKIIFVTAHNEYAVKAFEVNALDYLIKPINPGRLKAAVEKLSGADPLIKNKRLEYEDSIFILMNNKYDFLQIKDIILISASDNYSYVHTREGKKSLVHKTLKDWEAKLPAEKFIRIHKSSIINITEVQKIESWFNSAYKVYLKGIKEPVILSRRYFSKIKNSFN